MWSPWSDLFSCLTIAGFLKGLPVWREGESVIYWYNCIWALPEQPFSGPSPPELTTIFNCLIWDSLNLEGQVKVRVEVILRPTVSPPVCLGVRDMRPIFLLLPLIISRRLRVCCCGAPSLTRSRLKLKLTSGSDSDSGSGSGNFATDGQCLGVRPPCGNHDQIFITVGHSWSSHWVAPSRTSGLVCNLLVQFSISLRSKSHRTHDNILLSHLRPYFTVSYEAPTTLRFQLPIIISPRKMVALLYPRALDPLFVASYNSQGYGGGILTRLYTSRVQSLSPSYIMTDGQSPSLSWNRAPIWDPRPIFPLLSLIIFGQLRICWCGAPSLSRSRVYIFQLLLGIARAAFLRSESHGTHDEHILLSLFLRLSQPGGPGSCIYFLHEQCGPVIPPGHWVCLINLHINESSDSMQLVKTGLSITV
jgi:hypothetical protein